MDILAELKRRRVFRIAVAYILAAWLILQVADVLFPILEAPNWAAQVLLGSLAAGFLLAVLLAWLYELTPQGLKREQERRIQAVGLPVVADRQSIAILPFRDLSPAGDQAWFSEGIAEDLLNALIRLKGLKVASRTATFALASPDGRGEADLATTAASLGVAHVLAGSVRTEGQRIRVNARLIDAVNDTPLWSESFEGMMGEIFRIQDAITAKVVEILEVELGGHRLVEANEELTGDPEAYRLYLQGRQLWRHRQAGSLRKAIDLFNRAVNRDPQFHRAWSNMAAAHLSIPDYDARAKFEDHVTLAESAVDRALAIKPDASEALTIKAEMAIYQCRMVDAAHLFERAIAANPSDPTAHHWYSLNLARFGHVRRALEEIRVARAIDPLITAVIASEADYLLILGECQQAAALYREAADLGLAIGEFRAVRAEALGGNFENVPAVLDALDDGFFKELHTLWFAAVQDPSLVPAFENFLRGSDLPEGYFVGGVLSEAIAALGSAYLFEFLDGRDRGQIPYSTWGQSFSEQRSRPEFRAWMERWGVQDYWREFGAPDEPAPLERYTTKRG